MKHDEKKMKDVIESNNLNEFGMRVYLRAVDAMKQYAEHMVQQERERACNYIKHFPLTTGMVDIKRPRGSLDLLKHFLVKNIKGNEHNCEYIIKAINQEEL
tara:strand:+ start:1012 stop:1314 length:303 start_codon:yes stop_codon:yes gene_type:complete